MKTIAYHIENLREFFKSLYTYRKTVIKLVVMTFIIMAAVCFVFLLSNALYY